MKQQVVSIAKLQAAKIMAVLYLILSIPLVAFSVFEWRGAGLGIRWGIIALFPLMYVAFGFIFTFVAAWIYNGAARYLGGIEFTVVEVEREGSAGP